VEREAERWQVLVGRGDGRQTLEGATEVIAEEPDQATQERRRIGRRIGPGGARPGLEPVLRPDVEPGYQAAGDGERIGACRWRLEDGDRVGGQVRPAGVATRPRALEQDQAGEVAERLGDVDRSRRGDALGQARGRSPARLASAG
jgi:hypothetical protein